MNNIIKQFNDISLEFMKQSEKITGSSYTYQFKLMTKINSLIAIDMYIKNILPYKNYIYNKDERFFINMDIETSYMAYLTDIIQIKKIFKQLDKETKNNIWEYIQALTLLAEEKSTIHTKFLAQMS
jgi:hypothetical protein